MTACNWLSLLSSYFNLETNLISNALATVKHIIHDKKTNSHVSNEYSYTQRSLLAAVYRFVIMASLNTGMFLFAIGLVQAVFTFNLDYPANFTLREICNALATVKYKWFSIGIQLGVPYHKLKEFEKEAHPLVETVDYFLKGNVEGVPLSWDSIVTALKSDHVGEPALAKHLQNVYTQQEHKPQQGTAKGKCSLVFWCEYSYLLNSFAIRS